MADDDIYGNKSKYEQFKNNSESLIFLPAKRSRSKGTVRKYFCRSPANIKYFKTLFNYFEARDISYIRRVRLLQSMRFICHITTKDLAECTREDINQIVAAMHSVYKTPKSKCNFIKDIKYFWKILFPEKDQNGRPDETLVPYVVRHLSTKVDKSREKSRGDKLGGEEFERLVNYFSNDTRMQETQASEDGLRLGTSEMIRENQRGCLLFGWLLCRHSS